jgi:hypothetical protein
VNQFLLKPSLTPYEWIILNICANWTVRSAINYKLVIVENRNY